MTLTRRAFTGGALGATLGASLASPSIAQAAPGLIAAFAAIQRYGEADRQFSNCPG